MKKLISLLLTIVICVSALSMTGCGNGSGNDVDKDGKMILNLRNLYFSDWSGGDTYTAYIEDKFGVSINPTSYSWADWDSQVYGPVNSDNLTDVFHFSLDSYNFANSYEKWVKGKVIKALPSDMSPWPNLKKLIDNTSNIDSLYIDGALYCIPLAKDISKTGGDYSPFTYVYRRDWAKELGVYKEGDVYTWDEFQKLLETFYKAKCESGSFIAFADVEWGFPSIINFYKTAPHCFSIGTNGKIVCTYTTGEYLEGLEVAKSWVDSKIYGYDQYAANDGDIAKQYYAGRVGVFYENLSLTNYTTLRENVGKNSAIDTKEKLDDATAILKVSGPDGKYALEGTENWFSATFFSADISDEKQKKILDIMEWLLTPEGTEMAAFGKEGYDYEKAEDGTITLLENGWEKDINGEYIPKLNGAKYLRYMCTLGYDMNDYDPMVDRDAYEILNDWYEFMDARLAEGKLKILTEDGSVKWLSTPTKSANSGSLLSNANTKVIEFVYGKKNLDEFKAHFSSNVWTDTLTEINTELAK